MTVTPITPNFNYVEVRGHYVSFNGTPITGTITFTPSAPRLVDDPSDTIIVKRPIVATLDAQGSFSVYLPATNDPDITPSGGFSYDVTENFDGGTSYSILVPIEEADTGIDLGNWATVPTVPVTERDVFLEAITAAIEQAGAGGGGGGASYLNDLLDVYAPNQIIDDQGNIIQEGVPDGYVLTKDSGSIGYAFSQIPFPDYSNVYQPKGAPPDEWYIPQVVLTPENPTVPSNFPSFGIIHDRTRPDPTVTEIVNTVGSSGAGTLTLPSIYTATMHDITLTANPTLVFPTAVAGARITILFRQDSVGNRVPTWPSASTVMQWPSGSPPGLVTAANGSDVLEFVSIGGGRWRLIDHVQYGAAAPPASAPTIRGSFAANTGTVTTNTVSATLPGAIAAGDIGYLKLERDGAPVTPHPAPTIAGWNIIESPTPGGSLTCWLLRRVMDGTEDNSTLTWTVETASNRLVMTGVIVAGGTTSGEVRAVLSDATADTNLDIPGITPGSANNLLVAIAGIRYATSTDPSITPPVGWTELRDHNEGRAAAINFGGWAGYRTLSGQSGIAQPAVSAVSTHNETDHTFIIAIPPA